MTDAPIEQLSFRPTSAAGIPPAVPTYITGGQKRPLGDTLGDIVNVKNYGAAGNGVTDDTAAVQAAFDAAFGSYYSPHSATGAFNRPIFFPDGSYLVRPPFTAQNITGIANSSGKVRITHAGTSPALADTDMVYIRGVTGTTFANGSFAIESVDATHFTLTGSQFNAAWTGNGTFCRAAIQLRSVQGGWIFGGGRMECFLVTDTQNCALISTNGMIYSKVEGMNFSCAPGGVAFDLNAGTDPSIYNVNLQSNTFHDCLLGANPSGGDYCLPIGFGGWMGSETLILNCYFTFGTIAGIMTANGNALQNTVIGGNIANCGKGIYVGAGSAPNITGVGFQNNTIDIDINASNTTPSDGYLISGCRSESGHFINCSATANVGIIGCCHTGGGKFLDGNAMGIVAGCASNGTGVEGFSSQLVFYGNRWTAANPFSNYNASMLNVLHRDYRQTTTANLTLKRWQSGTCFDNIGASGAINLTLPNLMDSDGVVQGVIFEAYVAAAQQVRFTATNGLKIRDGNTSLSVANGTVDSSTVGSYITITSTTASGDWVVKSKNGPWVVT